MRKGAVAFFSFSFGFSSQVLSASVFSNLSLCKCVDFMAVESLLIYLQVLSERNKWQDSKKERVLGFEFLRLVNHPETLIQDTSSLRPGPASTDWSNKRCHVDTNSKYYETGTSFACEGISTLF